MKISSKTVGISIKRPPSHGDDVAAAAPDDLAERIVDHILHRSHAYRPERFVLKKDTS